MSAPAVPAGDRRGRAQLAIMLLGLLLAAVMAAALAIGPFGLPVGRALAILGDWIAGRPAADVTERIVLIDIRLPRMLLGGLVGAALAIAGAMLQGLFRNPLADPGLVGVSSGAALGAVLVIVTGGALLGPLAASVSIGALPVAAFLGGFATTLVLYAIATRRGRTSVATMLLAGIALGAFAGAVTSFLVYRANDAQLRELTFWTMGSLAGSTWLKLAIAAPPILGVLALTPFIARGLDALVLGESEARHLGIDVERLKSVIVFAVAVVVGVSVAFTGVIGFVGIVVPHLLRLAIGPEHRTLLPASALLGAGLLIGADIVCRMVVAPAELPIGIVTAIIGAPFFVSILLRRRGIVDL
ncbi:FecCD family ABC transporter permease [Kaistia soli]|nr:iron chelate uptake ABC transporter family permease subunit [Kaistia soli]